MIITKRRPRTHQTYFPYFGNIINEVINTPVQQMVKNSGKNITSPAVNIQNKEENYILQLTVPGHLKKDINITVDDDVLTIKSILESPTKEGEYRLREFNYAGFERKFTLPEVVDQNKIVATFENGILTLDLQKKEEAKPQPVKTITIK